MNIVVCVKQVPYPDTPASAFGVDNEAKAITLPEDVPLVISPFDENALEAGLKLKDRTGGTLTVLSLATRPAEGLVRDLKQALAMGAGEAVILDDPAFQGGDSASTAHALASAIRKLGTPDVVLCGLQAGDWDAGQVGLGIAEILGLPAATFVTGVAPGEGSVRATRIIENGHEVLELPLPCLLGVASDEALLPRIAPLPGILKAKKRTIPVWSAADIDADRSRIGAEGARTSLTGLALPAFEGACEFIRAEEPDKAAAELVERLRNEKIL